MTRPGLLLFLAALSVATLAPRHTLALSPSTPLGEPSVPLSARSPSPTTPRFFPDCNPPQWRLSWASDALVDTLAVSIGDTIALSLFFCGPTTPYSIYVCNYAGGFYFNTLAVLSYSSAFAIAQVIYPDATYPHLLSVWIDACYPSNGTFLLGTYRLVVQPGTPAGFRIVTADFLPAEDLYLFLSEGACGDEPCIGGIFPCNSVYYHLRSVPSATSSWSWLKAAFTDAP